MESFKLIVESPNYDVKYLIEEKGRNTPSSLYIQGPFLMANEANRNNRVYPLEEMVKEVGRYSDEMIKQNRALGELNHPSCLTESAYILGENGWTPIKDIKIGEKVFTLNIETDKIELQFLYLL